MKKMLTYKKIGIIWSIVFLLIFDFQLFPHQAQAGEIYKAKKSISKTADQIKEAKKQVIINQNQYNINQGQIVSTQSVIIKTQKEIEKKEKVIQDLDKRIKLNKQILKSYIQEMSFDSSNNPIISFVLSKGLLNDFSGDFDQMINVKEKTLSVIGDINQNKKELASVKKDLAKKKTEKQRILVAKKNEQVRVVSNIRRVKATLTQLTAKLNTLRSRLSSLLGDGVSMNDIKNAAKIASKATGVRKDFILGELVVESDLGRFTGGCYYSKGYHPVKKHMKSYDKTDYLKIIDDLGYSKNNKKLSCWPGYGYGGAMGIAQFMPSTWMGYKKKISIATGNKPSDPWNVVDGITGMAIKLARAGANKKSREHTASKIYYCGGSRSPYWHTKCNKYADNVQYWADNYAAKMN